MHCNLFFLSVCKVYVVFSLYKPVVFQLLEKPLTSSLIPEIGTGTNM